MTVSSRRSESASPRPQAMLFTLWGDYVVHRGGEIWVGSLIRIAAEFGLSELALRSVLSRMGRTGWLESTRHGNRSYYRLTRRGRSLIAEGTSRIFRPRRAPWDRRWQVVTYSIPEAQRELRDQFRKRLTYLGFGSLSAGAWISPHNLQNEVGELVDDLGLEAYVDVFRASYVQPGSGPALAERVWPLRELAAAYREFSGRWRRIEPEVTGGILDARAFVLRFWLIHEYQWFFLKDPDLPEELVPPDWPGHEAGRLFEALHDQLAPGANRFFDRVFEPSPAVVSDGRHNGAVRSS
jgi:phenylacetic acid degradation operon negative regulatory protein